MLKTIQLFIYSEEFEKSLLAKQLQVYICIIVGTNNNIVPADVLKLIGKYSTAQIYQCEECDNENDKSMCMYSNDDKRLLKICV